MDSVSIVIPTLSRPRPLERAVKSALAQVVPDDLSIEVIIIDNSPDGNAQPLVTTLSAGTDRALRYVSEPNPGIANARNCGARAASGRWVAFLDDDEEASPTWIAALVATARQSNADAVFGPVEARADNDGVIGVFSPYFARHIDRTDGSDVTDLAAYLGTNNSMFNRGRCLDEALPFDPSLNSTGGEDSLLLRRLTMMERRFAWAVAAKVIEWVPPRRLQWRYVWRRKFLSGQIRLIVQHKVQPARWDLIAFWMAAGAVQFSGGVAGALCLLPFRRSAAARALCTASGGLGKVLWLPWFRPAMYGTKLVS